MSQLKEPQTPTDPSKFGSAVRKPSQRFPLGSKMLESEQVEKLLRLLEIDEIKLLLEGVKIDPSKDLKQVPKRPDQQMLPADFILGKKQQSKGTTDSKMLLHNEAELIKEELLGYVDAIIQRQDRANLMSKMETLNVENAARRSLQDIARNYQDQLTECKQRLEKVEVFQSKQNGQFDGILITQGRHGRQIELLENLEHKVKELNAALMDTEELNKKKFDGVYEDIERQKKSLETRIDAFKTTETGLSKLKQEVADLNQFLISTKTSLNKDHERMLESFQLTFEKVKEHEAALKTSLVQSQQLFENYSVTIREQEQFIQGIKVEMRGQIDRLEHDIGKLVTAHDMKQNFRALSDLLFVKFSQLEDMKTAQRDMLVFQKYFYPLQMQLLITESLDHLAAAKNDHAFALRQKENYNTLITKIEKVRDGASEHQDTDFTDQYAELERNHLKTSEWKLEPLVQPQNDFFQPLLDKYLNDLDVRYNISEKKQNSFASIIRRTVSLKSVHKVIEELYMETIGVREAVRAKEEALKIKEQNQEITARCAKILKGQLDAGENQSRLFKRQNSFDIQMRALGDFEDQERHEQLINQMRRSISRDRREFNTQLGDCTRKRLNKDPHFYEPPAMDDGETFVENVMQSVQGSVHVKKANTQINLEEVKFDQVQEQVVSTARKSTQGRERIKVVRDAEADALPRQSERESPTRKSNQKFKKIGAIQDEQQQALARAATNNSYDTSSLIKQQDQENENAVIIAQLLKQNKEIIGELSKPPQYVQMPVDVQRSLLKNFTENLKPTILKLSQGLVDKSQSQLKTMISDLRKDTEQAITKTIATMHEIMNNNDTEFRKFQERVQQQIVDDTQLILARLSKQRTDFDLKSNKQDSQIGDLIQATDKYAGNFDVMAQAIAMLVENVNMQMEAEMADLLDRHNIALFGGCEQKKSKRLQEMESNPDMPSQSKQKGFGQRHRSMFSSPRFLSPEPSTNILPQISSPRLVQPSSAREDQDPQKIAITVQQNCLAHNTGHDTSRILKLFKIACLSYKASDVVYRDQSMSRAALINLRRQLIERITSSLQESKLFSCQLMYPRKYYDDLIMAQRETEINTETLFNNSLKGVESTQRLQDMLSSKLPFGIVSARHKPLNIQSTTQFSSLHASEHELLGPQTKSTSKINFIPGELSLDPELATDISQIQLKTNINSMISRRGHPQNMQTLMQSPRQGSAIQGMTPEEVDYLNMRRHKSHRKAKPAHMLSVQNVQHLKSPENII